MTGLLGTQSSQPASILLASVSGFSLDKSASNTLTLSQYAFGYQGKVNQALSLVSVVSRNIVANRSLNQTLGLSQVVEALRLHPASNTISFSQSATSSLSKGAFSTLTLSQSATSEYNPHNEIRFQALAFTQTIGSDAVFNRPRSHTLTLSQTAVGTRVKVVSASNVLVFVNTVASTLLSFGANTLVLSQTATSQKVLSKSASNTLSLQQLLARNIVSNLGLTQTFVFNHTYLKPTSINGVLEYFPIPEAVITKVKKRVLFRTKKRAIILKPPELGDGEGGTGKLVLQRTITGGTFAYARRTDTRRLRYSFETDTFKALEMRRFMLDSLSDPVYLENWKGELWIGFFTTNPFEMTSRSRSAPVGDRYSFEVEFEGERIH